MSHLFDVKLSRALISSYDLGTTLGGKVYGQTGSGLGGGMTLVGGLAGGGFVLPAHNQHQNKFNTISNIHKRSGGAGTIVFCILTRNKMMNRSKSLSIKAPDLKSLML